jgi:hypothetical protein
MQLVVLLFVNVLALSILAALNTILICAAHVAVGCGIRFASRHVRLASL